MTVVAKFRTVTPDERAPAPLPEPRTIGEAVERSERSLLVTMRSTVATVIDSKPPAHTIASLMRQLREIDREIRAIDARAERDGEAADTEDAIFNPAAV